MISNDYTYSGRKIKELTTENGAATGTRFYAGPFVFSSFSTTEPEWVNMPYGRFVNIILSEGSPCCVKFSDQKISVKI